MKKIYSYNLEDNLIAKLADFVQEQYLSKGKDLSRLAFVFGGKRPAMFLKKEIGQRCKSSYFSPRFFSIVEFVNHIVDKNDTALPVPDLDRCYTVYNIAKRCAPEILKGRERFWQFLPWAYEILAFIEKLDVEDIKRSSLENIKFKAQIGYDVPENINRLLENVSQIRDEYHKTALKEKKYSRGIKYLLAADYVKKTEFEEFDDIVFCDLFYLSKTEIEILKNLYEKNKATLFFQGSKKEWGVLDKLSVSLNMPIEPPAQKPFAGKLEILAGFDMHSQAGIVREVLSNFVTPHPHLLPPGEKEKDGADTVIVLPDPDDVIPVLSEISSIAGEFNVSLGYPLKRSSVFSLFEYVFEAQSTKKETGYYAKDYLKTLSHPFVKNLNISGNPAHTRIIIHKIDELLKGNLENPLNGSLFVALEKVEQSKELLGAAADEIKKMDPDTPAPAIDEIIKKLHRLLFISWENIANFRVFAVNLEVFMNEFIANSLLDKYPFNIKIAGSILSVKDELENVSFSTENFKQDEIFKIFLQKIENEIISFLGSPLKGLQVLGLFETRCLSFKNVIIAGVNEGTLPKLKMNEPLIPREVMLSLGLDTLEKEEEIQRYHFKRLIAGAENVYLIFNENKEKDREKSRFIEEIIWNSQKKEKKLQASPIKYREFTLNVLQGKKEIQKNPAITAFLNQLAFSASSVDTYLNCPARFYYQYVLGLQEKDDMLGETEGVDIGNFVHNLLENTYKGFLSSTFKIDDKFKRYFWAEFNAEFEKTFSKKMQADSFLLKSVLECRLKQFLYFEAQVRTLGKKPASVLSLEKNIPKAEIAVGGSVYKFKGRIDRIDKLEDGSVLVLDYKTGSILKKPSLDILDADEKDLGSREFLKKKVASFQLPLYVHFWSEEYTAAQVNAGLYDLRKTEINYLFDDKKTKIVTPEEKKQLMASWINALHTVLSEIRNPDIPFVTDEGNSRACSYCPFGYLCR